MLRDERYRLEGLEPGFGDLNRLRLGVPLPRGVPLEVGVRDQLLHVIRAVGGHSVEKVVSIWLAAIKR